jgi:uncharacterized BrkB/YihY/UPF0761 family membrane protein
MSDNSSENLRSKQGCLIFFIGFFVVSVITLVLSVVTGGFSDTVFGTSQSESIDGVFWSFWILIAVLVVYFISKISKS